MARNLFCYALLALVALSASCRPTSSFRPLRGLRQDGVPIVPTSLWDRIASSPDLSILKQLVQAAELVDQLSNTTALQTMFMPNNMAFAAFLNETSRNLTQLSNFSGLSDLLLYHLHPGSVIKQEDIDENTTINMAAEGNVSAALYWDGSFIIRDNAGRTNQILTADLPAGSNAIAHIISSVFTPDRPFNLEDALSSNPRFSTFLAMMTAGGYNATLKSNNTNMTFLVPTNQGMATALASMNMSLSALLANHSLVQSIVSTHIMPSVENWYTLYNYSGIQYFLTCNSCVTFYTSEEDQGLDLQGAGAAVQQSATIVESDLYAGRFALIQVLDDALLPLAKWTSKCKLTGQTPADGGKPSTLP